VSSGDAVEDRLHRNCGEQNAEHAHDHLPRRDPDQLMNLLSGQEKDEDDSHHRDDRGDDRAKQLKIALGVGSEHDRAGHGAGTREQGSGEGKHGDFGVAFGFGLRFLALFDRERRRPRALGERHVERYCQQDDAPRRLQGRERHAELIEDRPPEQGEDEDDQRGDEDLTEIAPFGPGHIWGERGQQHRRVDRAYDGKEGGERGERGFEHGRRTCEGCKGARGFYHFSPLRTTRGRKRPRALLKRTASD
jgi:hypothetical protein